MAAYDPDQWHELFVMAGGASAALAGLLFVAVSLNFEHVLKYRPLPMVAAQSVALLVAVVVASAFALVPEPEPRVLGIETLALGVVVGAFLCVPTFLGLASGSADLLRWKAWRVVAAVVPTVPLLGAGISLTAHAGGGMYWLLAFVVTALIGSTYNAWVLLIEIRR